MEHSKEINNPFYRTGILPIFLVFPLAFLIRLIHLISYTSYPPFDLPLGGNAAYVKAALKIVDGDILGGKEIFYDNSPIYSYMLAGIFKIFGIDFFAVRFLQIILGSLNCCLVATISRYHFGTRAALISGFMASIYGPFIFYDAEIIVLPWVIFFCLTSIVLIMKDMQSIAKSWLAGLCVGAAIMGRPNLILFPVLLFLYFTFGKDKLNLAFRCRSYIWFLIGVMVIPGIFVARNYVVSGEIVFLNPSGGHNFYFGHHKGASPVFDERSKFIGSIYLKYKEKAEEDMKRPLSPGEVSIYWYKKGLKFIVHNPLEELKLILEKILFFFNDVEIPTYFNYYFNKDYSAVLKHWVLTFGIVFPLSAIGFVATLERCRELMILYIFFLSSLLTVLIFFVISRLRIPGVPVIIMFAGAGCSYTITWCKNKALKPIVLTGLVLVPLYWFTFTPLVRLSYAEPHNHLGVVYWYKGRIPEAEREFLAALRLKPDFEYPLLNLVKMFRLEGNKEKEELYRSWLNNWRQRDRQEKLVKKKTTDGIKASR
nr:hypothetical protein [Desulfobacterales bacterium]